MTVVLDHDRIGSGSEAGHIVAGCHAVTVERHGEIAYLTGAGIVYPNAGRPSGRSAHTDIENIIGRIGIEADASGGCLRGGTASDRKSTRLNSSHSV